jgi:TctA family transporter
MAMGDGGWSIFFGRNISIFLMLAILLLLVVPLFRSALRRLGFRTRPIEVKGP